MLDTEPADTQCDVAIVGAGIVGLACARELMRRSPALRMTILDKESTIGAHQTSHNSGVIHAGIYYAPGSSKARLCVPGAQLMREYCERHGIQVRRLGKLIVATRQEELPRLRRLLDNARQNGVPAVEWLERDEIAAVEPHARGLAALHSAGTSVVDFRQVADHLAHTLAREGHALILGAEVKGVRSRDGGVALTHTRGVLRARRVLFCAGAWSDRLAALAGGPADPRVVPFRGSYLHLRRSRSHLVRGLIYPVPDPELPFLGAHLTRHVDDSVSLGPTALLVAARDAYRLRRFRAADALSTCTWPGTWRMAWHYRRAATRELRHTLSVKALVREAARLVPELSPADVVSGPAGVRAQALRRDGRLVDDFAFSELETTFHVRNAPSPAATSAFAIARDVVDRFERGAL